jgi:hypothetical protein
VNPPSRISVAIFCVAATAFGLGTISGLPGARASATHVYTLRGGDKVRIPTIQQTCELSAEGGVPDLFCARPSNPRHQVSIFRDNILIWRVGNPDRPAWSGKP